MQSSHGIHSGKFDSVVANGNTVTAVSCDKSPCIHKALYRHSELVAYQKPVIIDSTGQHSSSALLEPGNAKIQHGVRFGR